MVIDPDYEKAYSPTMWSKRFDSTEIISHFHQYANKVLNECKRTIPCQLDVPYGPSDRTKYDIYGTHLSKNAPVFIFIHGGYWQECSKDFAGFHVQSLVSNGIKVFNIGYDLCPAVKLGDIVGEIKSAIEKILEICRDQGTETVWIAGHSAGAHLAASLLHDLDWQAQMAQNKCLELLKGFLLVGGIYSLKPLLKTSYNGPLNLTDEEIKAFSFNDIEMSSKKPINNIKVIVTVGECDTPKFIDESRNYSKKLLEFVDHVEFLFIRDNTDHFDIMENLSEPDFLLTKTIINNILF